MLASKTKRHDTYLDSLLKNQNFAHSILAIMSFQKYKMSSYFEIHHLLFGCEWCQFLYPIDTILHLGKFALHQEVTLDLDNSSWNLVVPSNDQLLRECRMGNKYHLLPSTSLIIFPLFHH